MSTWRGTQYGSVRIITPGSGNAAQVAALDYANSEDVTMTGANVPATALPAGGHLCRVTNLGGNAVRYRGDGTAAAASDCPAIAAGDSVDLIVTDPNRVLNLFGTAPDVVVVTPYLPA